MRKREDRIRNIYSGCDSGPNQVSEFTSLLLRETGWKKVRFVFAIRVKITNFENLTFCLKSKSVPTFLLPRVSALYFYTLFYDD